MEKRKDKGQAPGRDKPRPVRYSHLYRTPCNASVGADASVRPPCPFSSFRRAACPHAAARPLTAFLVTLSLRSRCTHWLWQSAPLWICAGVLRMTLLRCPKFLRCLTADAGNFDRGHSLASLHPPPAALGSLPTTSLRTGLGMTRKFFRLPSLRGRNAPVAIRSPVPSAPLPKEGWHGKAVTGGFSRRTAPLVTPRPVITPSEKIPRRKLNPAWGFFNLLSASFARPKRFAG